LETFVILKQEIKETELFTLAMSRVENIKNFLIKENKMPAKQLEISKKINAKTSTNKTSNIDLKLSN